MIILTPKNDYKFICRDSNDDPSDDHDLDYKVVKETWVENVYQITDDDFWDTGILIDIGANIAAVSVYAASLNDDREKDKPRIKVIAYEPEPNNINYFKQNVKINGKDKDIKLITKAVWSDRSGQKISNRGGNSSLFEHPRSGGYTKIECITLEDIFTENKIAECDVLKLDCEGAEHQIISGASPETLKRIKYITLEFDQCSLDTFGAMVAKLAEVFNLHILGVPSRGGYIYGRRY